MYLVTPLYFDYVTYRATIVYLGYVLSDTAYFGHAPCNTTVLLAMYHVTLVYFGYVPRDTRVLRLCTA